MKNISRFLVGYTLVALLATSSCTKKLDDAYQNPNALVKEPVEQIFPAMIGPIVGNGSAAANSYGLGGDIINIGRYIQYWGSYVNTTADNGGTAFDKMSGATGTSTALGNVWGMYYFAQGANLDRIIQWGSDDQKWDFVGAATALRAWGMLETSNQYGEMIVREAFDGGRQQFDYDSQELTYDSVRAICHRALGYLNQTGGGMNPTSFGASDYYFNQGDLNRWKKFVYGVLARSYAYLSNKSFYNADSVIYYANLSCATNADNCTVKFGNNGVQSATRNYMGTFRANVNASGSGLRQSYFIANLMSGANPNAFTGAVDPRCWYMLRENPNGTFKGFSPSYSAAINPVPAAGDSSSSFVGTAYGVIGYPTTATAPFELGRYIFRNDAEFPIMTASEMQFILAEAYLRKSDFTSAKNAYVNGISLNFDMLTSKYSILIPAGKEITAINKADFLANPAVVPTNAANLTLTHILLQKYIALFGWGVEETWSDMRRFHYNRDLDPATGLPVYVNFKTPTGVDLWSGPNGTGSNNGKLAYRTRPGYNSEYIYDIPSLTLIGAYPSGNDYHTKECWFSMP